MKKMIAIAFLISCSAAFSMETGSSKPCCVKNFANARIEEVKDLKAIAAEAHKAPVQSTKKAVTWFGNNTITATALTGLASLVVKGGLWVATKSSASLTSSTNSDL